MNIGFVTTWVPRGAYYVSQLYFKTLSKEHRVFIYARGGEKNLTLDSNNHSNFVYYGKQLHLGIPTLIYWPDFKKWIIEKNLDMIIFNEQHSWDVILRTLQLDIKVGAYVDYYTDVTKPFFSLYDFLLCNTKRHYAVFKDHPQVIYIPWGVDINLFKPKLSMIESNDNTVTFFHSCGVSPYRKGTDLLVQSFHNLKAKARLIIHSQLPINDSEINRIINEDSRIQHIVETVEPPGLYHLGDIYVYPTRLEGIGLTIPESLASGLPVITTNNGPMNEFIHHGNNGYLVKVEKYQKRKDNYYWDESICDLEDLQLSMQYFIDNKEDIPIYQENARKFAVENLDWFKNSRDLCKRIQGTRIIRKPSKLKYKAALYEYGRYPSLILSGIFRRLKGIYEDEIENLKILR